MRYTALLTTITTLVFLGSCAKYSDDYIINSRTIAPLVVFANTPIKKGQNYYPVPNAPSVTKKASQLLPPGSNLEQFQNQIQLQSSPASQKKLVAMQSSIDKQSSLIISDNISQAWMKIGRALQKTSYQILDQDSTLSSFYILDIKSTNNKIIKATPIYRIYLKPRGNQTQVVLLNKNNQLAAKDVTQRILSAIQQKMP